MKVKFGVIGTNNITDMVLEGAKSDPRFELSAVYSRTYEKGKQFANKYNVKQVFTDLESMVACIDAVYIASPNAFHAAQACWFLERGIHVLCEKPFCSNAFEAKKMIEASKKSGTALMEAMISTLNPNFLALKDAIPLVGRVRKYYASYCQYSSRYGALKRGLVENAFKNELSNGALLDIGIYTIYPMVVLFGRPQSIKAAGTLLPVGVDGAGAVVFGYEGMEALVNYSKISDSLSFTEIQGEEGSLILDKINLPRQLWFKPRTGLQQTMSKPCKHDYSYEIKEFIDLIESGKTEHPINSHQNSLLVLEIMDEIRRQIGLSYPADRVPLNHITILAPPN